MTDETKTGPRILAVIHHLDDATSMANADMAAAAGVDGVVLIHMQGRDRLIESPARQIKHDNPKLLVVANRLSEDDPAAAIRRDCAIGLDGTWADNPGMSSRADGPWADGVDAALREARLRRPGFEFFGSVAFKTQDVDPDPAAAAARAVARGWIATTSGPATGFAPEVSKLEAMRLGAGGGRLAVASGVDPENARSIAPLVDWILVATGISKDFHHFDEGLVRELVAVCGASGAVRQNDARIGRGG